MLKVINYLWKTLTRVIHTYIYTSNAWSDTGHASSGFHRHTNSRTRIHLTKEQQNNRKKQSFQIRAIRNGFCMSSPYLSPYVRLEIFVSNRLSLTLSFFHQIKWMEVHVHGGKRPKVGQRMGLNCIKSAIQILNPFLLGLSSAFKQNFIAFSCTFILFVLQMLKRTL